MERREGASFHHADRPVPVHEINHDGDLDVFALNGQIVYAIAAGLPGAKLVQSNVGEGSVAMRSRRDGRDIHARRHRGS